MGDVLSKALVRASTPRNIARRQKKEFGSLKKEIVRPKTIYEDLETKVKKLQEDVDRLTKMVHSKYRSMRESSEFCITSQVNHYFLLLFLRIIIVIKSKAFVALEI